jgi:fatty-acyl-CoA synthase
MRRTPNGHEPAPYDPEWTVRKGVARAAEVNPRPDAGMRFVLEDGSERKFTFRELEAEVLRRGRWMLSLGLRKGDRAAFVVPGPMEFVLSFLGATAVGIVPVPLYPPMGFGKLDAYIRDTARTLEAARARVLFTQKRVETILWSLMDKGAGLERIVALEKAEGFDAASGPEPETVTPDDVCFLQFTSGSTAAPKGVVVTHRSLGANGWAIMQHGVESDLENDLALSWLPLYHDMGLIGFVIAPLTAGVETCFLPTLSFIKRPSIWMEKMAEHRATISFAPNFAYGLAVKRTPAEKVAQLDLSRVRILGAGAEPNNPATLQAFLDHFAPAGLRPEAMFPVYGMAEATLAMSFSRLDEPFRHELIDGERYASEGRAVPAATATADGARAFVSCGWTFPHHTLRVVDSAGRTLPDRMVGEVVFAGPSVAAGYFENAEATANAFRPDGLRTGDLGYMVDGELFVTGRKKDLIILNGRNYDPQSIEWVVADVDGVRMGNVIAFSRPAENTEELVVVAETRSGVDLERLMGEVRTRVRENFQMNPADVVLLPAGALPKTTSGKLQRQKARVHYLEGRLGQEGVRTMGERGHRLTLARHVAASTLSRVRHAMTRSDVITRVRVAVVSRSLGLIRRLGVFNRRR